MAQYNFRLFLKPTVIGEAIIERVSAKGADRQADARRWIELGYALEQAGFRLDGTTVYQGGRPISADTPVAVPVPAHWQQPASTEHSSQERRVVERDADQATLPAPAASSSMPSAPADAGVAGGGQAEPPSPAAHVELVTPAPVVRPAPVVDEMTANLRNLSM